MIDTDRLTRLAIKSLQNAYQVHEKLGDKGLEPVQKNDYGDISLRGDIEAEEAVIETFRRENIPLRIISEEHGQVDLADNPEYLAVLDGLDGTSVYKRSRGKGRYGTMLGIFSDIDPVYGDYIFSGVMEHSTQKLFFASKGKGSFLLENGKEKGIRCSSQRRLDKDAIIYADEYFDGSRNITFIQDTFLSKLKGYMFLHENSSAVHYVDLAQGKADLVLECTRKGNLEIAAGFGLISESGGVTVAIDGMSIKDMKYLELGQDRYIPVITASTMELAKELIRKINV